MKLSNRTERKKVSYFGCAKFCFFTTNIHQPLPEREITVLVQTEHLVLERNARGEQLLDDRRFWDESFQSKVEYSLKGLLTEGPEDLQLVQDAAEVVRFLLGLWIVSDVISQGVDYLGL